MMPVNEEIALFNLMLYCASMIPVNKEIALFDLILHCADNCRKAIPKQRRQRNQHFLLVSAVIAAFYTTVSPLLRADREIWALPRSIRVVYHLYL